MARVKASWDLFKAAPGDYLAAFVLSAVRAILIVVIAVGSMFLDLALGPNFMTRFAVANDLAPQGAWPVLVEVVTVGVPWALSVTTTGFQYMLLQSRARGMTYKTASKRVKKAIVVGWIIAVLDTLTDVAGFTAWAYKDPEVGKQIVPPSPHWLFLIAAVGVAGICLFHERMLDRLLRKQEERVVHAAQEGMRVPGTWMVEFSITICRWAFFILSNVCKAGGVLGSLALDFILSAFFVQQLFLQSDSPALADNAVVIGIVISGFITGYQFMDQRAKQGERKQISWMRDPATIFKILDVYLDLAGFSTYMYGIDIGWTILPNDWTPALILMLLVVGSICMWSEYLANVFLAKPFTPKPPKAKKPKKGAAAPVGGGGGAPVRPTAVPSMPTMSPGGGSPASRPMPMPTMPSGAGAPSIPSGGGTGGVPGGGAAPSMPMPPPPPLPPPPPPAG